MLEPDDASPAVLHDGDEAPVRLGGLWNCHMLASLCCCRLHLAASMRLERARLSSRQECYGVSKAGLTVRSGACSSDCALLPASFSIHPVLDGRPCCLKRRIVFKLPARFQRPKDASVVAMPAGWHILRKLRGRPVHRTKEQTRRDTGQEEVIRCIGCWELEDDYAFTEPAMAGTSPPVSPADYDA